MDDFAPVKSKVPLFKNLMAFSTAQHVKSYSLPFSIFDRGLFMQGSSPIKWSLHLFLLTSELQSGHLSYPSMGPEMNYV